jgi:predicted membrane channel-forming protein YqfA (hemolysin III family)
MPSKMSLKDIAQAAEDVRTIKKFQDESVNHGFQSDLISATVTPFVKTKKTDWPLISMAVFIIVVALLVSPRFFTELSPKIDNLFMVLCLIAGTLAVLSAHIKFKDKFVSVIVSIGMVIVISIGFDILTPKEALNEAKEIAQGK